MSLWIAALLGIVEGLTEYLPVSSTGHLILAGALLGEKGEASKSFEIVIQLGAILAVVVHYRALLAERIGGLVRGEEKALRLALALLSAFVPTAFAGLLLRKTIKAHLFGPAPVAGALIVGGVIMIAIEMTRRSRSTRGIRLGTASPEAPRLAPLGSPVITGESGLEKVTPLRGFWIGLGQIVSLWPGSSRSMCTIVAGQLTGLSTATAAEFSFLLALPTLGAATIYEAYKGRHELLANGGAAPLAVGLVVSFFVAWAVIAAFLKYLQRHGLTPFGFYRLAAGALVIFLLMR